MKNQINLANFLLSLSDAIDLAHSDISLHQMRTAFISYELCKEAGFAEDVIIDIFIAALFHDVGAITIEEKVQVHSVYHFESTVDLETHCMRGELLLNRIPFFKKAAEIVRYHHKRWDEWGDEKETPKALSSQVLVIADCIERLISRDKYILHLHSNIIDSINAESGKTFNPVLVRHFNKIAAKESFWLDMVSPLLYSILFNDGPLKDTKIDFLHIESISKLFRDLIDFKSPFTATHTSGVSSCAVLLSQFFHLPDEDIFRIEIAGNLHDIGKLSISNLILNKRGGLNTEESAIMKSHPYYTYKIVNSIVGLQDIAEVAGFHHENLNGEGYPFHHTEENLTVSSRIIKVADIYTAISEDRPYRPGMTKKQIYAVFKNEIASNSVDKLFVELLFDNYGLISENVNIAQSSAFNFYQARVLALKS